MKCKYIKNIQLKKEKENNSRKKKNKQLMIQIKVLSWIGREFQGILEVNVILTCKLYDKI